MMPIQFWRLVSVLFEVLPQEADQTLCGCEVPEIILEDARV